MQKKAPLPEITSLRYAVSSKKIYQILASKYQTNRNENNSGYTALIKKRS